MSITLEDFAQDAHGRKYVRCLESHPAATDRLLVLLNDPCSEHRLEDAEDLGHSALSGIARFLDRDPDIGPVLEADNRFRQAIGVAVRLKMEELGWQKTGTKGPVVATDSFSRAERYKRRPT